MLNRDATAVLSVDFSAFAGSTVLSVDFSELAGSTGISIRDLMKKMSTVSILLDA